MSDKKQKDIAKKCWQCGKVYSGVEGYNVDQCEKCGCVMFKVLDKKPNIGERAKDKIEQMKLFGG